MLREALVAGWLSESRSSVHGKVIAVAKLFPSDIRWRDMFLFTKQAFFLVSGNDTILP